MNPSLTVVLPVHNAEATLSRNVIDALEVAGELTEGFRILIVDDGSTDDTFDTAVELSNRFPQVLVMRNAQSRGLGPTLRSVKSKITSEIVIVHDGTSKIDANQIRSLWREHHAKSAMAEPVSIHDLHLASKTHESMAAAHSKLMGFQLLTTDPREDNEMPERRAADKQNGVGVIPPLPRPNFLGSLTNFALGE